MTMKTSKRATVRADDNHEPGGKAPSPQPKFLEALNALDAALVERREEVELVLTALLCKEHVLLVGPPGTAKSRLLEEVMRWMKGGKFSLLLTKFTTPEEVCGPVSLEGMKQDGFYRITDGMLPEADATFLDEVWKASSAILNTLLTLLNERVYKNGTRGVLKCPLKVCVAASNEWPQDQELGALFDRFLFRKAIKPVSRNQGRKALLTKAVAGDPCRATFPHFITPAEVDQAAEEAAKLPFSGEAKKALWEITQKLDEEGVTYGDRRLVKAIGAARAYTYLHGAREVKPEHLEVLSHVLWDDPAEQPMKCAKVIAKIANPVGSKATELYQQAEDVVGKAKPTEAVPELQKIQKELEGLPQEPRVRQILGYIQGMIKESYRKVIGADIDNTKETD